MELLQRMSKSGLRLRWTSLIERKHGRCWPKMARSKGGAANEGHRLEASCSPGGVFMLCYALL